MQKNLPAEMQHHGYLFLRTGFLFLDHFKSAVYNNTLHPTFKGSFKFILMNVGKYFYESFLQHVFSFWMVAGIAQANRHHPAGILLKKHTLAKQRHFAHSL